jgi:hypothetical protein
MLPPAIAEQLRMRGHDVLAVAERADLRSLPDREVFALAQTEHRVVMTRNVADYVEIDREQRAAGQSHAGLVLVSSRFAPAAVGPLVKALHALTPAADRSLVVHWL